jgi:hypothetical protein
MFKALAVSGDLDGQMIFCGKHKRWERIGLNCKIK